VQFALGSATAGGTTDASGVARATVTPAGPQGLQTLSARFAGDATYGASSDSRSIPVSREDTVLTATTAGGGRITATLREDDGPALAGRTVTFSVVQKVKGRDQLVVIGSVQTDGSGVASFTVPNRYLNAKGETVTVGYAGDAAYLPATATVVARR
jgi:hypothetical protein